MVFPVGMVKPTAIVLMSACLPVLAPADGAPWVRQLEPFLSEHCYDCHDDVTAKGGLNLLDLGTELADAERMRRWTLVHDRVAAGEMPPEDKSRPGSAAQKSFLNTLGRTLFEADEAHREVVLRRLNRVEYEFTLRDLFRLPHLAVKDMLPEDAKSHGFDNVGEALGLSPEQMLVYLDAADHAIDAALGPPVRPETRERVSNLKDSSERALGKLFRDHPDGVVLFSSLYSPSVFKGFDLREEGTYRFRGEGACLPVGAAAHSPDLRGRRRHEPEGPVARGPLRGSAWR